MHVAIDIGAYKTTMFSTEEGGSVIFDEFGKREFSTVLALTAPLRSFGKGVSGDAPQQILLRKRGFFHAIHDEEAQKHLFMYLKYLGRTVGNSHDSIALVIPEYFGEEEKAILRSLADAADIRIDGFITHVTGVAACAVLRNLNFPEQFAVFDFGYRKSSAGLFEFKDARLVPLRRAVVRRGAADFDDIIYTILIKKFGLSDTAVTRERLFQVVGKIKQGLNELETVSASIFGDNFENIKLEITKAEFYAAAQEVVEEIRAFVDAFFKETGFAGKVEVVGNNYNSLCIKDVMRPYPHATLLHPSESAALGGCLAFGVNSRNTKYRVEEILGSEISLRVVREPGADESEKQEKMTTVFRDSSVREKNVFVKYSRSGPFVLELFENGKPFGLLRINKEESEGPEKIKINMKINSFSMVEVVEVTSQESDDQESRPVDFVFENRHALSAERVQSVVAAENEYAVVEDTFKKTGEVRHATETYIDSFISVVDKNFPSLLTSDEKEAIEGIADKFFSKTGGSLEAEMALRDQLISDLKFVGDKLRAEEEKIGAQISEMLEMLRPYTGDYKDSEGMNFHRLKLAASALQKSLNLSLEKFGEFDRVSFENLRKDIDSAIILRKFRDSEKKRPKESECCEKEGCCRDEECCKDDEGCKDEDCCKDGKECCKGAEGCCKDENPKNAP